jgi:hypothetical protein
MKGILLTAIFSLAAILPVFSQAAQTPDLPGYKKITSYPVYTPDNLFDFIDGAADNYLSYGFEEMTVVEYEKGKNTVKLEIYRHRDNTNAFGIYSSERSPRFQFLNIGAQGYKADGVLNFLKGRYYVKIWTNSTSSKTVQILEPLALRVADALSGGSELPKTLTDFPEGGRRRNEETYISSGVLGHDYLKGAFKAVYENGEQLFSVYIIDGKSDDETRKTVNTYLSKCKLDQDNSASGKYVLSDGYNGDVFLSWKDNRTVIIQGLAREQTEIADRFTSEILK